MKPKNCQGAVKPAAVLSDCTSTKQFRREFMTDKPSCSAGCVQMKSVLSVRCYTPAGRTIPTSLQQNERWQTVGACRVFLMLVIEPLGKTPLFLLLCCAHHDDGDSLG